MTSSQVASHVPPLLTNDHALFLDFDGTLAGIAEHPSAVTVRHGVADDLTHLRALLGGAVAIVTGRRLEEVDRHLQPLQLAGAGAHGAELRCLPNDLPEAVVASLSPSWIASLQRSLSRIPGVWLEDKRYGVAVHFRQNPSAAADCERVLREAIDNRLLDLIPGHFVVEVRHRGIGKGPAVAKLLEQPVFEHRIPVFVGDDVADEEGFRIVQRVHGWGIKVGAGETAARYRLADVDAVHGWLQASARALSA